MIRTLKKSGRPIEHKVDVSNVNIIAIWVTVFELYVVSCRCKNKYQKDICSKEIGLSGKKYTNHFRVNDQHEWGGGTYMGTIWTCYLSCTIHMFLIL